MNSAPVSGDSGIYMIANRENGDFYVGSAVDLVNRWAVHRRSMRAGLSTCRRLQNAWTKYGEDSFTFDVLEFVSDKQKLVPTEQQYLDLLLPPYNIRKVADSNLGLKVSEATKSKIADALRGEKSPWYGVRGPANPLYGRTQPDRLKAIWSEQRKGEKNPMYGVTPTHAKLAPCEVRVIRELLACGARGSDIAKAFGISKLNVSHIKTGRTYRGVY